MTTKGKRKRRTSRAAGKRARVREDRGVVTAPAAVDDEPRARRIALLALAAGAVLTLAFFWSFVSDRQAMIFGTDMIGQAYQSRAFAVQEVQAGRGLPQWNPFVYAGIPYLSILPYPVYYPTSLLYFAIPLHRAIGWAFVLHFLLAGVLAYGLARELRLAPGAAIVTGIAYMFTGYLVSHLYAGQDGRMFAMTWTPALFLLAERAIARRRIHWFAWMAAVVALQVFTPHVQMMYFAAMAVGAYVLFRLAQVWRAEGDARGAAVLLAGFAGAYALAGLLTLVEVWPTWNMVQFSHRAERGYEYASSWSMPVQETLAMVWPAFQGYLDAYWGTNPFKLHTEYVGAVPALLALVALFVRRGPRVWFFAVLAFMGLLFAWGSAVPVHRIFYWILPMMESFRAPAMMFSVVALAVVVLAGYGAQTLYDRRAALADLRHPVWKVAGGLGAAWILLWFWAASAPDGFAGFWAGALYGPLDPARAEAARAAMPGFAAGLGLFALFWAAGVAVLWLTARDRLAPLAACTILGVVALVDLWRVDRDFYDTFPADRLTTAGPAVEFLQRQPEPFRVLPLPDAFGPNDLMLFRLESVTGSQNFRLRWWDDLVGEDMARLGDERVWRLLNIRYLVSGRPIEVPGLDLVHSAGRPVYAARDAGPAAWVVHRVVERPAGGDPAAALLDDGFDPATTALLEPGAPTPRLTPAAAGSASVEWRERLPDRHVLDVETPADGLLVLSDVYHPYWRATVDGRPAPVLHVDVALRGVPIPAGRHRVELGFRDPNVARGAWASLASALVWIGIVAGTWRRRGPAASTR